MNEGFTYTSTIAQDDHRKLLLAYLTERFTHTSEAAWRTRILDGRVLIGSDPGEPDSILQQGQIVSWIRPPWEEAEVPLVYAVLFEDLDLLAVAKPSGLPTMPSGGFLEHCLSSLVRKRYPEASPVHRLGRGTSGLVLFARTTQAMQGTTAAWREHRVEKIYRALATGRPEQESFTITTPIGPVPHAVLGTIHAASPTGKPATSHVHVLDSHDENSLVEVRIETGRPHQIRIHMAACGHPLVGDPLYIAGGVPRTDTQALPGDEGYLLHAMSLALPHPRTGTWLRLECAPPPELR